MKTGAMMVTAVLATAVLAGCAAAPQQAETGEGSGAQTAPDPSAAGATPDVSEQDVPAQDAVVGTVVRFASDRASAPPPTGPGRAGLLTSPPVAALPRSPRARRWRALR